MLQLSFSQLKLYKSYPLDYFYKYILKLPEKDTETKWCDFGNAVHEVLEEYYKNTNKDWQNNCIEKWNKYKLEGRMNFEDFKKNVINGISLYLNPTELEKKILINIYDKVTFLGYLDVYSDKDDYIIDWKTGTYTKNKEEDYKVQLLCYAWMFYKINNRLPKKCSIMFLKQKKLIDFTFTLEQVVKFENFVKKTANEIIRKKAIHKKTELWGNELGFFSGYKYLDNLPTQNFSIEIRNSYCFLGGSISELLLEGIDKATRFDLPNKHFIQKAILNKGSKIRDINEIGRVHVFDKRRRMFSLGLISTVKDIIYQYGEKKNFKVNINIVDLRDKKVLNFHSDIFPNKLITDKTLRPYQLQAISSYLRSEGLGFLEVATGGGKTMITAEIIRRLKTSTLWIIDKKELLNQTKKEFEDLLGIEIGVIGEGKFEPKIVTVATIQSLNSKMKDLNPELLSYLASVNFVIVDESHHSSSSSYENVFRGLVNTKYRLGTTATAKRDDGKEPIMFSLLGPIIYKIGSQELIDQGYLMKPTITFYKIEEKIDFKKELNIKTKRLINKVEYSDEYDMAIVTNEERNNKVIEFCDKNPNKKILIITKIVAHGEYLFEELLSKPKSPENILDDIFYIHGSVEKNKRKEDFEKFKKCKKGILIATSSIASEGLDIPDLQVIINVSGNKSDIKSIQALGRILRKIQNKTNAEYIDFLDIGRFGGKHSKARINIFKKEGYEVNII